MWRVTSVKSCCSAAAAGRLSTAGKGRPALPSRRPQRWAVWASTASRRGTRLYDGKDHFTIYDFVKAHHHFSDPEWDGEPADPEPAKAGGGEAGAAPEPDDEPPPDTTPPDAKPVKTVVKLADGKARTLQHMSATTFWSAGGKPMSAAQFLETQFGALPEFFRDEDKLRAL